MINPLVLSGTDLMVTDDSAGIGKATVQLLRQLGAEIILANRTPGILTDAKKNPTDKVQSRRFLPAKTCRWITGTTLVGDGGYIAHQ